MKRASTKPSARLPAALKDQTTIVNAAALQDHIMRSMTLHTLPPRASNSTCRPSRSIKSDVVAAIRAELKTSIALGEKQVSSSQPFKALDTYRRVWVCETCTFENDEDTRGSSNQEERCRACGLIRPKRQSRRLSLAQQRGLVQAPPPKLSRDEWERCENQAMDRGDANHPCSICREPFGVHEHVILSCSHMFHLSCIQSFERFLRTRQRVCPLCRKENYQKRMTSKAASVYRERCARLIQAVVRGHRARKQMEGLWHDFYRRGRGDPTRRRRFLAQRVGKTTDRLVTAMRARDDSIDSLLAEFDRTISLSRRVFDPSSPQSPDSQVDWAFILRKAQDRGDHECPICLNALGSEASLLSCSHTLHAACLLAFETFNIYEVHLCPVCRSGYQARHWSEVEASVKR